MPGFFFRFACYEGSFILSLLVLLVSGFCREVIEAVPWDQVLRTNCVGCLKVIPGCARLRFDCLKLFRPCWAYVWADSKVYGPSQSGLKVLYAINY